MGGGKGGDEELAMKDNEDDTIEVLDVKGDICEESITVPDSLAVTTSTEEVRITSEIGVGSTIDPVSTEMDVESAMNPLGALMELWAPVRRGIGNDRQRHKHKTRQISGIILSSCTWEIGRL